MKNWGISHVATDKSGVLSQYFGRCRIRGLRICRPNFLSFGFRRTYRRSQRTSGIGDGIVRRVWLVCFLVCLTGTTATAQETAPLSAIDWLSDSVSAPLDPGLSAQEPATATTADVPSVRVSSLDSISPNAVGIFSRFHLPPSFHFSCFSTI